MPPITADMDNIIKNWDEKDFITTENQLFLLNNFNDILHNTPHDQSPVPTDNSSKKEFKNMIAMIFENIDDHIITVGFENFEEDLKHAQNLENLFKLLKMRFAKDHAKQELDALNECSAPILQEFNKIRDSIKEQLKTTSFQDYDILNAIRDSLSHNDEENGTTPNKNYGGGKFLIHLNLKPNNKESKTATGKKNEKIRIPCYIDRSSIHNISSLFGILNIFSDDSSVVWTTSPLPKTYGYVHCVVDKEKIKARNKNKNYLSPTESLDKKYLIEFVDERQQYVIAMTRLFMLSKYPEINFDEYMLKAFPTTNNNVRVSTDLSQIQICLQKMYEQNFSLNEFCEQLHNISNKKIPREFALDYMMSSVYITFFKHCLANSNIKDLLTKVKSKLNPNIRNTILQKFNLKDEDWTEEQFEKDLNRAFDKIRNSVIHGRFFFSPFSTKIINSQEPTFYFYDTFDDDTQKPKFENMPQLYKFLYEDQKKQGTCINDLYCQEFVAQLTTDDIGFICCAMSSLTTFEDKEKQEFSKLVQEIMEVRFLEKIKKLDPQKASNMIDFARTNNTEKIEGLKEAINLRDKMKTNPVKCCERGLASHLDCIQQIVDYLNIIEPIRTAPITKKHDNKKYKFKNGVAVQQKASKNHSKIVEKNKINWRQINNDNGKKSQTFGEND